MTLKKENSYKKAQKRDYSSRLTGKNLSKLANACSLFCSVAGTTLIAFIVFGPRSILNYRNVQLASNFATGLLGASFLLCVLGAVLGLSFKRVSKNNSSNIQVYDAELYEESGAFKTSEVKTAKLRLSDEAIVANSNVLESQKTVLEVSADCPRRRFKNDSVRLMTETNLSKDTPKSKATALYTERGGFPAAQNQLVPVKRQYDIPPFQQCVTRSISSGSPNRWNFMSNGKAGTDSITEVVATKRVRFLSGDYAHRQEEYEVKQTTTFFKYPNLGFPSCKISEISNDHQSKQDIRNGFHSSEGTTKPHHLSDVISMFGSLQF